jgi:AraC-like DNA-binding protein
MASFYVVVNGGCRLQFDGADEGLTLNTGDLAVLLYGRSHWLQDDPQRTLIKAADSVRRTTIVRGRFAWDQNELASLLPGLPPVIHFRNENGRLVSWMARIIQVITDESASNRPGARAVINQMAYAIFVQSVRAHLAAGPPAGGQTIEFTHHRQIGQALYLLHNQPEAPWSLPLIARKCGMSRSAFADGFKRVTGKTPMMYLLECRMKRACELLSGSSLAIKEISTLAGYGSQPAFSNAFRRWTGRAPGVYRKTNHSRQ